MTVAKKRSSSISIGYFNRLVVRVYLHDFSGWCGGITRSDQVVGHSASNVAGDRHRSPRNCTKPSCLLQVHIKHLKETHQKRENLVTLWSWINNLQMRWPNATHSFEINRHPRQQNEVALHRAAHDTVITLLERRSSPSKTEWKKKNRPNYWWH